jgi:hypothetical protein
MKRRQILQFATYLLVESVAVLKWIRIRIWIQIHQIHMILGLPVPDPLVRSMDPDSDPSIIMKNSKTKP